jgi:hypothetical protein
MEDTRYQARILPELLMAFRPKSSEGVPRISKDVQRVILDDEAPRSKLRGMFKFSGALCHKRSRNCSTVSPASRTIPPRVKALTGLLRGIDRMRVPFDMTICFP